MSACIRCGLPPEPGKKLCGECALRRKYNPPVATEFEPPNPPCSEELAAACAGRIAKLEDEVHALRVVVTGLSGQLVELLREAAKEKPA